MTRTEPGPAQRELFAGDAPPVEPLHGARARFARHGQVLIDGLMAELRAADSLPWTPEQRANNEVRFALSVRWLSAEAQLACRAAFDAQLRRLTDRPA